LRFPLGIAPAQLLDLTFKQSDACRAIHGLGACIDSAFEHAKIIARSAHPCTIKMPIYIGFR
jgi:hypothetical protein